MKSNILNQELKKIKDSESWCRKSPQRGDHIRIKDTLFYHHALYISNNEVIHFTYGKRGIMGNEGILESTSLKKFSRSNIPEVRIYSDHEKKHLFPIEKRINNARNALGNLNYDLIFSNCEHYINYFTMGKFISKQLYSIIDKPILKANDSGINKMLNCIYNKVLNIKE